MERFLLLDWPPSSFSDFDATLSTHRLRPLPNIPKNVFLAGCRWVFPKFESKAPVPNIRSQFFSTVIRGQLKIETSRDWISRDLAKTLNLASELRRLCANLRANLGRSASSRNTSDFWEHAPKEFVRVQIAIVWTYRYSIELKSSRTRLNFFWVL